MKTIKRKTAVRPATAKRTVVKNVGGFATPMGSIDDIDVRIRTLESEFGIRGQLNVIINRGVQAGSKALGWMAQILLRDGGKEVATVTGSRFDSVANRLFKDSYRWLKIHHVGGLAKKAA